VAEPKQSSEASKLISDLKRRISSLQQILSQTLQQHQIQELRLAQSGASEQTHSEHMTVLDRSVGPITRDLNDFQSRKRIYEKLVRLQQSAVVPCDYFFGHVYLDTSEEQQALATYSAYARFVTGLGLKLVAADLPIIGSWIRNILTETDAQVAGAFEEKLRELSQNQSSPESQLLKACKDIPQCIFQIGPLMLIKYVDADKTTKVCHTLDSKQMIVLREEPSTLNKPKDLAKALGLLEQSLNIIR